jgi:hypothetical protein
MHIAMSIDSDLNRHTHFAAFAFDVRNNVIDIELIVFYRSWAGS